MSNGVRMIMPNLETFLHVYQSTISTGIPTEIEIAKHVRFQPSLLHNLMTNKLQGHPCGADTPVCPASLSLKR